MIVSLLATVIILLLVIVILAKSKDAYYRPQRKDIKRLLEWVLLGQAMENDWHIFCDMPIRHDEFLESIRLQCVEIEEAHFLGEDHPYLFTQEGLVKIRELLDIINKETD